MLKKGPSAAVDEETPLLSSSSLEDRQKRGAPTALPRFQLGIALLLQLCEPVCSQSIYPYINELVSTLDIVGGDKRKVGYYAGLIESLFFMTEALTVLQWGRLSDRTGRKPVMLIGLVGSCISMLFFGLSRTFCTLVISRCLCGLLNGNVGVMKSVIGEQTDASNRADAFALVPVAWAAGAAVGPLIGGSLSNPQKRFPTIFTSDFWKEYPYFLPCLVAAGGVFVATTVTFLFFEETLPKHKQNSSMSSETSLADPHHHKPAPPPLRQILIWPVIISVANYASIAFLDLTMNALLPLFFAMPIEYGGLGFSPPTIGYLMGTYGVSTGILCVFLSARILRRFGEKRAFFWGTALFVPIFLLMPIMNMCARTSGVGPFVWALVAIELLIMPLINLPFSAIFTFITASAPDKRSLGATNGLSQTTASIARALGPALSTSLFSFSVQYNILGGYGVYVLMTMFSLLALGLASFLPECVWDEETTLDRK
ncbi:hypothetical protein NP233_g7653 [Leucocoprinus birnbaumii]|uniref:Major facilitator superfamily (MFS) profile domain-containing protein n=1 Tax=Leucocoprinus birnbaumii TaxID=56174 RepID=A0AAD5VS58_9AGAR|nr:hypothetical protein NP233_g7653 [Leucocoprinus birnbaumii]